MVEGISLTDVLDSLDDKAEGEKLTLGAMVDAIGSRGYGPLILAAALVELMPTGGIPGIPTMVAITVIIFSAQLVAGRERPWVPQRLRNKGVSRNKFNKAREKVKPLTTRIDHLVKPRLSMLVTPFAARVVGVMCILLALTMPPLEIMPFLSYIPAFAIAFFALGLCTRDGLIILLGFMVAAVGAIGALIWLLF